MRHIFRVNMSPLQGLECILDLPRATPGAIQIVSPSGLRTDFFLKQGDYCEAYPVDFFTVLKGAA